MDEIRFFKIKLRISQIPTDCWVPIKATCKKEVHNIMTFRNQENSKIDIQYDEINEIDKEKYKQMLNRKLY